MNATAHRIVFVAAVALFVGARLWHLTATCLWFDEVFSVHAARHSWLELFRFAAADIIHPPLFYAILKLWIGAGGESLWWLRLLPLIFAVATIVPFYLLARELKLNAAATNYSLLLMAVSGFLIKYAQEVRMYSLLLFLSVTSIWLFVRFAKSNGSPITVPLAICNFLLVYTHYFGWLLIVAEGVLLLTWHRKKLLTFVITAAALLASYVPWIYAVATYREPGKGLAQNIGWISRPKFGELAEYFVLLSKPFLFSQSTLDRSEAFVSGTLLLLLLVVTIAFSYLRRFRGQGAGGPEDPLLVLVVVPLVLAVTLSWLLPYSVWGTRHLIICAVPFLMIAGIAVEQLRPYWAQIGLLIVFGCVVTLAGAIYLIRPAPQLSWCAWDGLLRQVPAADNSTVTVYSFEDLVAYHLWFAAQSAKPQTNVKVVKGIAGIPEDPAFFLPRRFPEIETVTPAGIQGEHFWVAFRARRWDESSPPMGQMKMLGYTPRTVLSATALGEQAFLVEVTRPNPVHSDSTSR